METLNRNDAFVFVLHSHIPYVVSHGKWPHGTDWLSEAAAETYIPLLRILRELEDDKINTRITISISPILAEQLADTLFQQELSSYLEMKISAAEDDRKYFQAAGERHMMLLAENWIEFYASCREDFEKRYQRNILNGFTEYLEKGVLDIITCGATHGYFPLIGVDNAINLQVKAAVETHKKHFKNAPTGIWMPECAYRPGYRWKRPVGNGYPDAEYERHGIEEFLAEHGIEYTFIDSHLLRGGKAIGAYANRFEGLKLLVKQMKKEYMFEEQKNLTPNTLYNLQSSRYENRHITLFTRDPKTSLQVWSGEWGYPGDGWYMDFHKKRFPGGLRYWRVTGAQCGLGDKEVYDPGIIESRIDENAAHFVNIIHSVLKEHKDRTGAPGVLTSPFDAELFGHWWFEGITFIKKIFQKLNTSLNVTPMTAKEAAQAFKPEITVSLPEGSWGEGGFHYIWLNEHTDWTWRDLYQDELTAIDLVNTAKEMNNSELSEIVTQLIRELMLAHSSDWQFLISTFSARDYAEMRFAHHHNSFQRLAAIAYHLIKNGSLPKEDLYIISELCEQDHPFQHLLYQWYAGLDE